MLDVAINATDRPLLDLLRKKGASSIGDLTSHFGVTATAIRQRLQRLMGDGLVERSAEKHGRGRPSHRYRLSTKGQRLAGDNYGDLAEALWQEVINIEDAELRKGVLKRVANRLAEGFIDRDTAVPSEQPTEDGSADQAAVGGTLAERMKQLKAMMGEREVPFEVDETSGLPVLTAWACPYPGIADHDPSVCEMEKMMISEVIGQPVERSEYRLDGANCCCFQPVGAEAISTEKSSTSE